MEVNWVELTKAINLAKPIFPFVLSLVFVVTRIDLGNIFMQFGLLQLITDALLCLTGVYPLSYPLF